MRILLVEPYDTGSHGVWMRGYQAHSAHDVRILSLEGQFWQWRMQGGAVALAEQFRALERPPDLIVASDMLDLTTFLALTRPLTARIPAALYFHENQLTYPAGPRQKLQQHYAFINYASALAADAVFFNSAFHRDAFFEELPRLLKHYPDHTGLHTVAPLRTGAVCSRWDSTCAATTRTVPRPARRVPPAADRVEPPLGIRQKPGSLLSARSTGWRSRTSRSRWRWWARTRARIRLSSRRRGGGSARAWCSMATWTHLQRMPACCGRPIWWSAHPTRTFFGISIVEAIYCGCWPLLPDRLNYPALVPPALHSRTIYGGRSGLTHRLRAHLTDPQPAPPALREHVAGFDWRALAPQYDAAFAAVVAGG
ncbi:MAG: DUF3524 domain-containing protein [Sandaracinaceae bacterium]|nr:DUF3524 domain-containing protein [Sandaracinaceae bacterium]